MMENESKIPISRFSWSISVSTSMLQRINTICKEAKIVIAYRNGRHRSLNNMFESYAKLCEILCCQIHIEWCAREMKSWTRTRARISCRDLSLDGFRRSISEVVTVSVCVFSYSSFLHFIER